MVLWGRRRGVLVVEIYDRSTGGVGGVAATACIASKLAPTGVVSYVGASLLAMVRGLSEDCGDGSGYLSRASSLLRVGCLCRSQLAGDPFWQIKSAFKVLAEVDVAGGEDRLDAVVDAEFAQDG